MSRSLVVVPCFNEAARLDRGAFLALSEPHRLLMVDDGSRDDTLRVLREMEGGRIAVLALPRNVGKAEAVRQGLLRALDEDVDYVGYWDADLATPLEAIPSFVGYLDRHPRVDAVLGSRVQLLGKVIRRQALRHYVGRVFATAAAVTLGLPVYDTQCGAKMLRAGPLARRLFEEPFTGTWTFDVEWLARYLVACGPERALEAVHELPLEVWTDVAGSKVRPWDLVRSLWELWEIRRRYFRR